MKILKQLFLFGVVFLSVLVVCELFIKVSHLASVSTTEFYEDRGRGKRPNVEYLMFNEGFGIVGYNQYTYIGEARPPEKPENTIRIALMGDSFIESWQVFERHQFSNIAESILSEKYPDKNIEVLNFGHSNLDIADQYVYYKLFAQKFNPDITLFMLADYNLEPRYVDKLRPRPIIENDSLVLVFDYPPAEVDIYNKTKALTQNSSLFHMLNISRKKAAGGLAPILLDKVYTWFKPRKKKDGQPESPVSKDYHVHPVTEKIIESLNPQEVVFVSRDIHGLPKEFEDLCTSNGFNYFELKNLLSNMKNEGLDPYEWKVTQKTGHWNHRAHQEIGNELAKQLAPIIENK